MQTIEVAGGNLYALAAQYLQDATQWIRIAIQNGLTDPELNAATLPAGSTVFRITSYVSKFAPVTAPNGAELTTSNGNAVYAPEPSSLTANPIGVFVLEIPDTNPKATGGVPPQ